MFRHILLPTDGSLLSAAAIDSGLALARSSGAKVTVLTVIEPLKGWWTGATRPADPLAQDRVAYLDEAERKARALDVPCTVLQVEDDHPYRAIVETARHAGCDLIAMASHGRRGVAALVIGSETNKVLTHSSVPVLVFR